MILPPVGAVLVATNSPRPVAGVRPPALLDLAVRLRSEALADSLLAHGADPLLPERCGRPPLLAAIGLDTDLGGHAWTERYLGPLEHVPADLLAERSGVADELLLHPDLLGLLVARGLDREGRDDDGGTWLSRAATRGRLDRAGAALALGADPNLAKEGTTTLAEAVESGNLELVELLLEAGADPDELGTFGERPLHKALEGDHDDLVDLLLEAGADPGMEGDDFYEEPPPIHIPMDAGDAETFLHLLPYVKVADRADLAIAALGAGQLDLAQAVLDTGVALDPLPPRLSWPSHSAQRAWLRERGARWPADSLATVARWSELATVKEALADGARVDLVGGDEQRLPAEQAVERGDAEVAELLIAAGARLPADFDLVKLVRDNELASLDLALRFGAPVTHDVVRATCRGSNLEALERLAQEDPPARAWRRKGLWQRDVRKRVAEIRREKR